MITLKKVKLAKTFGTAAGKYCAMTVQYPIVNTDDVVKQASLASGLPAVSIKAAVDAYLAAAETFMSQGHRVRLGKLGLFGVKSRSEATTDRNAVSARLLPSWRASSEFRAIVNGFETQYTDGGTVNVVSDGSEVVDEVPDEATQQNGGGHTTL